MDCNILNNYIPVLYLTFLAKVIEKAVAFYINNYLMNNNLNLPIIIIIILMYI